MNNAPLWRAEEVVHAVRGRCLHEQSWSAFGVTTDDRAVVPGDLFIALQTPIYDGHDHVAAAFSAGAAAALVSRQPTQVPPDAPLVFVENTFLALQDLGCAGRKRAQGIIIAVTGSIGKTSTKEMIRLCLGAVGRVYACPDSNKAWDLPLALACLPSDADYGVFEMGVDRGGDLTPLSLLVCPDIAVITSSEAVNLEKFGSMDALVEDETRIFQGMTKNGTAILDRDNLYYARFVAAAKKKGIKRIRTFSEYVKADATLDEWTPTDEGSAVRAIIEKLKISYVIGAHGMHFMKNSLAALLAAYNVSGKLVECASALSHYSPTEGCGDFYEIALSEGGQFRLINESSSATPASVRAAIRVLSQTNTEKGGRRILVLGDMDDLGLTAPDEHISLVPDIRSAGIALVFCCGDTTRYLYDALPETLRGAYAVDSLELTQFVVDTVEDGDVLTVKGSESMEMGRIVAVLKATNTPSQRKTANG